jgi:hypothetical protein
MCDCAVTTTERCQEEKRKSLKFHVRLSTLG